MGNEKIPEEIEVPFEGTGAGSTWKLDLSNMKTAPLSLRDGLARMRK